jgi:hypothetical protein
VQHPNTSRPPPPCCDHVATIFRPCCDLCCVQHPTSRALPPPPRHKSQHHMSVTSKLNIRNIKIQCLQHLTSGALLPLLLDATLNITCLQYQNVTSATSVGVLDRQPTKGSTRSR